MTRWVLIGIAVLGVGGTLVAASLSPDQSGVDGTTAADAIERGRYLVKIGGCNDCHTPGYLANAGEVPEERWLIGDALGFNGPWGTTYPSNLRQLLKGMDEEQWVQFARDLKTRPPMPWFNLRAMTEPDLRAIHRYVRSLPADDTPVPEFVPPGRQPTTPYIVFEPQVRKP